MGGPKKKKRPQEVKLQSVSTERGQKVGRWRRVIHEGLKEKLPWDEQQRPATAP